MVISTGGERKTLYPPSLISIQHIKNLVKGEREKDVQKRMEMGEGRGEGGRRGGTQNPQSTPSSEKSSNT